ncbi:hypothetical protein CIK90_02760 [Prevotella sp. P5-126]|nr:hypothetical protein CIK90_02760 [Prevotella sp. P5-126]
MARKGAMKWNVFVKPDEQNKARFNSAMARKSAVKRNVFVKPDEQSSVHLNSAMARKGAVKRNDLYLKPRVESIKEDNVESNCSMTRKLSSKRSEFPNLICNFAKSIVGFSCLFLQH